MKVTLILHWLTRFAALTLALLSPVLTQASVVINSTRIIYPQQDKEVTIRLESKNQAPVLLQVWLDDGDEHSTPDVGAMPFVVTPPIFRIEPGKQHVVRMAYTGETLPSTQESLYWFNLLEVPAQAPSAEQANQLQLAFRTRIKVFFRPPDLPYPVEAAPAKLQWRSLVTERGPTLEVYNPTPYYLNFDQIEVVAQGQRHAREPAASSADNMVAPHSRNQFQLPGLKSLPASKMTVEFQSLDDFGLTTSHSAKVSS
ncbi:fimbrial biogenesis chaperone [Pseudomonas fluorescens]|uniref:fimbrial biogenesis chaperone n=1 Tax=Pseudomonas fluorescens TaxID=294 RepID=UPI00093609C8|nr:fimbria/pilus periplasmic chaperone [Pseudomonas fluorescens]